MCMLRRHFILFFFFTHPATPEFYTLSLHDPLPISVVPEGVCRGERGVPAQPDLDRRREPPQFELRLCGQDRKSTRLNSSHRCISYAVFCLKKKKARQYPNTLMRSTEPAVANRQQ